MNVGQLRRRLVLAGVGEEAETQEQLCILWGNLRTLGTASFGPPVDGVEFIYVDDTDNSLVLKRNEYGRSGKGVCDLLRAMSSLDDDVRILLEYESGCGDYGPLFKQIEGVLTNEKGDVYLHPRDSDVHSNTCDQDASTWRVTLPEDGTLRIW